MFYTDETGETVPASDSDEEPPVWPPPGLPLSPFPSFVCLILLFIAPFTPPPSLTRHSLPAVGFILDLLLVLFRTCILCILSLGSVAFTIPTSSCVGRVEGAGRAQDFIGNYIGRTREEEACIREVMKQFGRNSVIVKELASQLEICPEDVRQVEKEIFREERPPKTERSEKPFPKPVLSRSNLSLAWFVYHVPGCQLPPRCPSFAPPF